MTGVAISENQTGTFSDTQPAHFRIHHGWKGGRILSRLGR